MTVKAYASYTGYQDSDTITQNYVINATTVSQPVFQDTNSAYEIDTVITITCSTGGASITYTVDGTDPVTDPSGTAVSGGTSVNVTLTTNPTTIKAYAHKVGLTDSSVVSRTYNVQAQYPTFRRDSTGGSELPDKYVVSSGSTVNVSGGAFNLYFTGSLGGLKFTYTITGPGGNYSNTNANGNQGPFSIGVGTTTVSVYTSKGGLENSPTFTYTYEVTP